MVRRRFPCPEADKQSRYAPCGLGSTFTLIPRTRSTMSTPLSRNYSIGLANRVLRVLWVIVRVLFYRPSPRPFHFWRRFLLRLFGAKVAAAAHPYPGSVVWAPWNLEMGYASSIGDQVQCYNVDKIVLGPNVTVSQFSYLCTASHDYTDPDMPLITAPIVLGERAWVCAGALVGPGVTVGEGAVVGARAVVFRDVPPWMVVAGNPAQVIKARVVKSGVQIPSE